VGQLVDAPDPEVAAALSGGSIRNLRGPVLVRRPTPPPPPVDTFGSLDDPPLPGLATATLEASADLRLGDRASALELWALVRDVAEALGAIEALAVFDHCVVLDHWRRTGGS